MKDTLLSSLKKREHFLGPLSNPSLAPSPKQRSENVSDDKLFELQHWQVAFDLNQIAWLVLDKKDSESNVLSQQVIEELDKIIDILESKTLQGLVIRSAKRNGFCLGADITEFQEFQSEEDVVDKLTSANTVLNRLEGLQIPSVAIIHGHCLGGGLELALRCRYRMAINGASMGFPEIQLGLIPGLEGTVRLTHMIDPIQAMSMILTGKPLSTDKAKQLGLVDQVLEERHLENALQQLFNNDVSPHHESLKAKLLTTGIARKFEARQMAAKAARKAPPEHYPAPGALIELWEQHGSHPETMAKAETTTFAKLLMGDTAKQLIRVFFLSEKLKALGKATEAPPVNHVHVVGAGTMGGDIAIWCAYQGLRVSFHSPGEDSISGVIKRAHQFCQHKHLSESSQRDMLDRLIPDFNNAFVAKADLIIEAVPEKLDIKLEVYRDLEAQMQDKAILASNTSSIPLETLSESLHHPERFVGLHFFNPVAKMKLIEVVAHRQADDQVLARARAFAGQIERFPVPVKSAPGFLVNRALSPYLMEAMTLLDEGVQAEAIDQAAERFGMPVGPIEVADQVGLDICLEVASMLREQSNTELAKIPDWLVAKVDKGELGRKTGKGIYVWEDGKAEKEKPQAEGADITDRLVLPMLNACMATLAEQVIEDQDLLDAAMIFGTGFAPFRGGPMHFAQQRGFDDIHSSMQKLANKFGERFKAHDAWQRYHKTGDKHHVFRAKAG